ncbi:MAG: hypothetical protein ACTMIR_14810 [Cellulomonadaceae bacterium]
MTVGAVLAVASPGLGAVGLFRLVTRFEKHNPMAAAPSPGPQLVGY